MNQIVIGHGAQGTGNNEIALGNGSITAIRAVVQAISEFSDRRLKRDLQNSPLSLVFINALRPVRYRLKNPADYPTALREARFTDDTSPRPVDDTTFYDGLIAQEVKATLDRLGVTWSGCGPPMPSTGNKVSITGR